MAKHLIVLDIDNTVFDWVTYYVNAMGSLFKGVSEITGIASSKLETEAKQVFTHHGSIEYPFLIQELPSVINHFNGDIERILSEAVSHGRKLFNDTAREYLKPYPSIPSTLGSIRSLWPECAIIALTDAPRYVAMWKLNKLGLLGYFDAVYGLPDPKLPTDPKSKKAKVDAEILLKHLEQHDFSFKGLIRTLPIDYEKPGVKGLKTVLMDFDMEDDKDQVLWVGDNLRKDVGLGKRLGVKTVWAQYGTNIEENIRERLLAFSPDTNVARNVSLDPMSKDSPTPDYILPTCSHLSEVLKTVINSK